MTGSFTTLPSTSVDLALWLAVVVQKIERLMRPKQPAAFVRCTAPLHS